MIWLFLLGFAVCLQLFAAYQALRLIGPSRNRLAWVLIAAAFFFLGLRLLVEFVLESGPGYRPNPLEEIMNLFIAGLCLGGVHHIQSVFKSLNRAEAERQSLLEESERQRLRAEARATEAEEKKRTLEALMAYIPAGVVILGGRDLSIRYISRHATELSGRSEADLKSAQFGNHVEAWGVCHSDGSPAHDGELPVVRAIREGKTVCNEEWGMRRADGSCYIALASAGPILDAAGDITGGVVSWQDITDLKAAQEELRQSNAQLRAVFENIQDGLIIAEPNGTVLERNPASLDLLGYRDAREAGATLKNAREIFQLHTLEGEPVAFEDWPIFRALHGENFVGLELRVGRSGFGKEKILSFNGTSVRNESGEVVLGVLTLHDVTASKVAEAAMRRAREEAEAASRAKSEFLANLSHELRTPMTAIMGFFDLLKNGQIKDDGMEYLPLARKAAHELLKMIEDLLDLSAIEAQTMIYRSEPFDLQRCIEASMVEMQVQAKTKGLLLSTEITPEVPQIFVGDAKRIAQVIRHLTDNAIKFTEDGGIAIRVVPDSEDRLGTGLPAMVFSVRDSGIGIPPEVQGQLFNNFRQADGSSTRRYGGLGMGLSLCKKMVEGMGGCIGVESELGRGSLFFFVLPVTTAST